MSGRGLPRTSGPSPACGTRLSLADGQGCGGGDGRERGGDERDGARHQLSGALCVGIANRLGGGGGGPGQG
jgi:hypothetical protein